MKFLDPKNNFPTKLFDQFFKFVTSQIRHFLVNPNIGDVFDPEIHEAVMNVSRSTMPDAEPNTIAFVQKTGYNIKDQVLRPCWVGVIAE